MGYTSNLHHASNEHDPCISVSHGSLASHSRQQMYRPHLRYSSKVCNLWCGHPSRCRLYLSWWPLLVCGKSGYFGFALKVWQANPRFTSVEVISYCLTLLTSVWLVPPQVASPFCQVDRSFFLSNRVDFYMISYITELQIGGGNLHNQATTRKNSTFSCYRLSSKKRREDVPSRWMSSLGQFSFSAESELLFNISPGQSWGVSHIFCRSQLPNSIR